MWLSCSLVRGAMRLFLFFFIGVRRCSGARWRTWRLARSLFRRCPSATICVSSCISFAFDTDFSSRDGSACSRVSRIFFRRLSSWNFGNLVSLPVVARGLGFMSSKFRPEVSYNLRSDVSDSAINLRHLTGTVCLWIV